MKHLLNFTFLFLFISSLSGQVQPYYNGLDLTKTGNDLFIELSDRVISTHTAIPYSSSSTDTWDVLKQADEDPDNNANVLLVYGYNDSDGIVKTDRTRAKSATDTGGGDPGRWNREHVYAKSLASPSLSTGEPGPGTDVHNLRPADSEFNSNRSNRKFTDGSGTAGIIGSNGGWYPGDEWKGDIARAVMYMYLRYNGNGSMVSQTQCFPVGVGFGEVLATDSNMIDLFLRWNQEDPVSAFEDQRNPVTEGIQGNRNPFIDNPYLATLIWGGINAEDRWNLGGSSDTEAPTVPTSVSVTNIMDDAADISWNASTDNVAVIDYLIYLDGAYLKTSSSTATTLTDLTASTTYALTIKARDAASNLSDASTTMNITTLDGPNILFADDFEDCANSNFEFFNEASNKDWACQTMFGETNSGSMGMNGYQEDTRSKDWLITKTSIDMDSNTGEKLSFYTDAAYGSSPLELVYSSSYNGADPSDFTWTAVPNVTIPIHSNGSSTEEVYAFSNVDISGITGGSVYFAFKYYSNGSPTRWTVDSFEITADDSALAVNNFDIHKVAVLAYPNPSNGNFKITIPVTNKQVTVALYTMQAQLISKKLYTVTNGIISVDIKNNVPGMYIAKVQLEKPVALKIIKI